MPKPKLINLLVFGVPLSSDMKKLQSKAYDTQWLGDRIFTSSRPIYDDVKHLNVIHDRKSSFTQCIVTQSEKDLIELSKPDADNRDSNWFYNHGDVLSPLRALQYIFGNDAPRKSGISYYTCDLARDVMIPWGKGASGYPIFCAFDLRDSPSEMIQDLIRDLDDEDYIHPYITIETGHDTPHSRVAFASRFEATARLYASANKWDRRFDILPLKAWSL